MGGLATPCSTRSHEDCQLIVADESQAKQHDKFGRYTFVIHVYLLLPSWRHGESIEFVLVQLVPKN